MSALPQQIEEPLIENRLQNLKAKLKIFESEMLPEDYEYATQWIYNIFQDYKNGLFNIDETVRKDVAWDTYSYARYNIMDSITGFLSEICAVGHINKHTTEQAIVHMAPDNEEYQVSGIDLIMNYPRYEVSYQVKTGRFVGFLNNLSIVVYPDWVKQPAPKTCPFHRIAIVNADTNHFFAMDYEKFRKAVGNIKKPTQIDMYQFRKYDKHMTCGLLIK